MRFYPITLFHQPRFFFFGGSSTMTGSGVGDAGGTSVIPSFAAAITWSLAGSAGVDDGGIVSCTTVSPAVASAFAGLGFAGAAFLRDRFAGFAAFASSPLVSVGAASSVTESTAGAASGFAAAAFLRLRRAGFTFA